MALLDQFGRKVEPKKLVEYQAEGGVTGVRQSFMESAASGMTPQKLAGVFKDADEGNIDAFMILAEEMEERDPHLASVLGQRKRAVSGVQAIVAPASEDKRDVDIAEWVKEKIVDHDGFSALVEDLLDSVGAVEIKDVFLPLGLGFRRVRQAGDQRDPRESSC